MINKDTMEIIEEMEMEIGGISKNIFFYTTDGNINNYLTKLKKYIRERNVKSIKYCLSSIYSWYEDNIEKILSNSLVYNKDSHAKNMEKIKYFIAELDKCQNNIEVNNENKKLSSDKNINREPIIFLSHCSKDKKYGDALRDFIIGLGIEDKQLIYTSHPLHKIPLNENIYEYLRKHLSSNMYMVILWSDDYLDSVPCLNEMGALWVTQKDYTNIYVPNFDFNNPKYNQCAVDKNKMGAVLNGNEHCRANMISFKDIIQEKFNLKNDEQKTSYLIDEFIKKIK